MKKYAVYNQNTKCFVSYLRGMFSSDCWTVLPECANRYTLNQAIFEREWISKVCHVKITDLIICDMQYTYGI